MAVFGGICVNTRRTSRLMYKSQFSSDKRSASTETARLTLVASVGKYRAEVRHLLALMRQLTEYSL